MNKCVLRRSDGGLRNYFPFHQTVNSAHHARSALNPWLNLIGTLLAGGRCTACSRSIMRRKKARPGRITLQAWFNKPISDSSSLRVQLFLLSHYRSSSCRRVSLSWGNRSSPASISTWIPKNVTVVAGPSILCVAIGTPSCWHWSNKIDSQD